MKLLQHGHFYQDLTTIFSADIISTVQFNHDGEFLATGDKGGRVVIFQKDLGVSSCPILKSCIV